MSGILQQGLYELVRNGAVELLVFMLIFTLVFAILQKIKLFVSSKEGSAAKARRVHILIAIAIGILTLVPRYSGYVQYDVVTIIEQSLPQISLVVVAIIGVILLLGLLNMRITGTSKNPLRTLLLVVTVGVVIWIFGGTANWFWRLPNWLNSEVAAIVIALLVFGIVVSFVMGEDKNQYPNHEAFEKAVKEGKVDWKRASNSQKMYDMLTRR
jgi:uncharacterized membrane protein YwzB